MLIRPIAALVAVLILLIADQAVAQDTKTPGKYQEPDSVANLYTGHSLEDRFGLVHKLTDPFSDDELKFRAIFKWVCLNIENDYDAFLKNHQKRKKYLNQPDELEAWNKEFGQKVFDKLLSQNRTVCTGYTYLLKEMAFMAGIDCVVVDGYGRGTFTNIHGVSFPNHSWNAAKLNGTWYLFDATWASGSSDADTYEFIPNYEEGYFMTEPNVFMQNHYPLDTSWLLMSNKPTLNDFLAAPLVYKAAIRHDIRPQTPEWFEVQTSKGSTVRFEMEAADAINPDDLTFRISRSGGLQILKTNILKGMSGSLYFDYVFNSRGLYTVHIYLKEEPLISYEVRVIK